MVNIMKKVVVCLSGGIDSAVTALILKEKYEVLGLTAIMSQNNEDILKEKSSKIASLLGIKHYIVDIKDIFQKEIISYFAKSYIEGKTPSPCVMCNKKIKFGILLEKAKELGASFIATGHYAKIVRDEKNFYHLFKATDNKKDQSYFLSLLNQEVLSRTLFPLASFSKEEIRDIGIKNKLPIKTDEESQDLCFVNSGEHYKIIEEMYNKEDFKGTIKDTAGKTLKTHEGFYHYTVGQRKGLGVSAPCPLYVKNIEPKTRDVIVAKKEDIYISSITVTNLNWIVTPPLDDTNVICKIRYNNKGQEAKIKYTDEKNLIVQFSEPVFSATSGQLASFYTKDGEVLGGGWIN